MENIIEKIVDKISTYEFLNKIIPGTVFMILGENVTTFTFHTGQIWFDFVLAYFFGLVISRFGSLVIEKILIKNHLIEFLPYNEFVKAEEKDKKMQELSMIGNMYRSFASVAMCLLFTVGLNYLNFIIEDKTWSRPVLITIGCILLLVFFILSYIKQVKYVTERIKTVNNNKNKD